MPNFIKNIFQSEPYRFFTNPIFEISNIPFQEKIQNMKAAFKFDFKLLFVWILIVAFEAVIAHFLKKDPIFSSLSRHHSFKGLSNSNIFFLAVLSAPIIEEAAFRSFLNYTKQTIAISLGALIFSISKLFLHQYFSLWHFATAGVLGFLLSLILINSDKLNSMTINTKKVLLYLSCLIFGLLHLNNYRFDNVTPSIFVVLLFGIIPQLISTISLCYVRLKNGLIWSIFYHAIFNMIAITPALLRN